MNEAVIEMLEAEKGDCILITYKDINILIDGGVPDTYEDVLEERLEDLEKLDLVVITHIDRDHIGGILRLFEEYTGTPEIGKVLFNSGAGLTQEYIKEREIEIEDIGKKKSAKDAISLESKLLELDVWKNQLITDETEDILLGKDNEVKIEILAPRIWDLKGLVTSLEIERSKKKTGSKAEALKDLKDLMSEEEELGTSPINKSSIVLLIEIEGKKMLFTGDSSSKILEEALEKKGYSEEKKLELEVLKLPHHGSSKNLSKKFLSYIDCKNFLISTDGESHSHPNKESFAKIINNSKGEEISFYFNYNISKRIFSKKDKEIYTNFECLEGEEIKI